MKIIGLVGKKRSGKTTIASMICKHTEAPYVMGFADAVKKEISKATGYSIHDIEIMKSTFRPLLQWWGTDFRRRLIGEDYWVNIVEEVIKKVRVRGFETFIIPDVRFLNEAAMIKEHGGLLVRVYRMQSDASFDSHQSETELEIIRPDVKIYNEFTLDQLEQSVVVMLQSHNIK